MTTVTEAVEQTRRLLYGSSRPNRNQLTTTITATQTTLVYTRTPPPPIGSLICIGQELMYVWDKVEATSTLTVTRGELGTTGAAHTAADEIEVNARFPRPLIVAAIQDEIRSWEPDLFRVVNVAYSTTTLPAILDLGVNYLDSYGVTTAKGYDGTNWLESEARLIRGLPTATFPSTVGVQFLPASTPGTITRTSAVSSASSFQVGLAMPFDLDFNTGLSADLVDDVGLARSMVDLAVWGAAIRLLASAEVSRTDPTAQGQARDVTQVRVGDQTQVAASLTRRFDRRFEQEVAKMLRRNPVRF